jgi:hypothetical protein
LKSRIWVHFGLKKLKKVVFFNFFLEFPFFPRRPFLVQQLCHNDSQIAELLESAVFMGRFATVPPLDLNSSPFAGFSGLLYILKEIRGVTGPMQPGRRKEKPVA